jgi:sigma-54 dependent transcriptional regulator, acetoin dehydrogenase operon transcriptional activator AcoR
MAGKHLSEAVVPLDPIFQEYILKGQQRGVQGHILESWQRCSRAGLNPYHRNVPSAIDHSQFKRRMEQRIEIVELFRFYTRRFTGILDQLGACAFVCDHDGLILSRIGYGRTLSFFDNVSLFEGGNIVEEVVGTNAPGLALVTREPVMVTADEHYTQTYHPAFCVASPILDENRNLLGCVDITKLFDHYISEDVKKHLFSLALSLSDMIRNEVFLGRVIKSSSVTYPHSGAGASAVEPRPVRGAAEAPAGEPAVTFSRIVGTSPPIASAVRIARSYVHTEGNILIQGETGTGKELFARAIHADGPRADGPFVAVNCAAIPLELAESELFGHPGKFEMAHHGTIFLDEINSMPLQVQAKILRVVETKRVSRINGKREIPVNVRVITASNGNMSEEVSRGAFRKDLFFRLNVLPLRVPPLRDMKEDFRDLLEAFLRECAGRHGAPEKRASEGAFRRLAAYEWPGNVRELKNCVEYLCYTVEGEEILEHHLPPEIIPSGGAGEESTAWEDTRNFRSLERMFLVETMRRFQGNAVEAARMLGVSRSTLYRKLKKHGITP